jgi:hypothetical protein
MGWIWAALRCIGLAAITGHSVALFGKHRAFKFMNGTLPLINEEIRHYVTN